MVATTAPSASKLRPLPSGRSTGRIRLAAKAVASASGTFTKNTQLQPKALVSTPPRREPAARPALPMAPHTEVARLRSGPGAKVVKTSIRVAGVSSAPPTPWAARAATSRTASCASPPASEESA